MVITKRKKAARFILDFFITLVGAAIFGLGIHVFILPGEMASGGMSGVATIVNHLTGFPVGSFFFIINIPLIILAVIFLGKDFLFKTAGAIVFFTYVVDVLYVNIPVYNDNRLVAAIFGGTLVGIGLALAFMRDGSTGGTDILNRIIQLKFPYIKLGKIVFAVDFVVIASAAIAFRSIDSALYSLIVIFVGAQVMDKIMYGLDKGRVLMIVTTETEIVVGQIMEKIGRGCTVLEGKGAFTGTQKEVILCAVRQNQFYKVKTIVNAADAHAFMMILEAGEVLGLGFDPIQPPKKGRISRKNVD
ncbi:MAG: YitT family protein [Oscillospiraceae bacterium]|nr:YitT family protein [Oscillospiraceae bacterium]